jgi:hypothetical protein
MEKNISDKILRIDGRVRFAGIVSNRGEVIEGGFQEQIEPLVDQSNEQQLYLNSLSVIISFRDFSDNLGKIICNITEYRKVLLMTFPLDANRILCVSASPGIDIRTIRDEILKIIGSSK